jgi:NhaC family Na+:H+ antiporter
MAGTDLITHVRYMTHTTVPSIAITLIIFLIMGFFFNNEVNTTEGTELQQAIVSKFNINGWLFLVPLAVIVMIVLKIPAIPALLAGTLLGGIFAVIFQGGLILELGSKYATTSFLYASYVTVIDAMTREVAIVTNNELINELLSSKGMGGMLNTIWLIICAMSFGGVMETSGMLKRITHSIIALAQSTGSLIATTAASCILFNLTASDQYLSIVVPGRMFAEEYRERKLHPKVLSRTLEDAGTVTSVLVPWNTCGAYNAGVLGVATGSYLPYCFFNIISPFMTIFFGFMNIKIAKLDPSEEEKN